MTPEETKALIDRARTAADVVSSVTVLRHTIRDLCDALAALSSHPDEETLVDIGSQVTTAYGAGIVQWVAGFHRITVKIYHETVPRILARDQMEPWPVRRPVPADREGES